MDWVRCSFGRLTLLSTLVAIHTPCIVAQTVESNNQADAAVAEPIPRAMIEALVTDRSPKVEEGRYQLPSLAAPTTAMGQIGNGRLPESIRANEPVPLQPLPEDAYGRGDATWTVAAWVAPNTFSHPLYFQDRMLERHGQERFPRLQPMVSGARFFAAVPMLPYLATVRPPCDCEYTLGYYRSGSCAPVMLQRPPYERRAVIAETAAIAAAIIAFP